MMRVKVGEEQTFVERESGREKHAGSFAADTGRTGRMRC